MDADADTGTSTVVLAPYLRGFHNVCKAYASVLGIATVLK